MTHTTNASSSAPEERGGMCGLDGFASGSWGDCARTAASYPGETAFLDERAAGAACDFIGLSADLRVALLADLPPYARQPQLRRAVWHCRALLAADDFDIKEVASWPMPTPKGGADQFYALVVLSLVERTCERHAARGIPPSVTRETLFDLEVWARDYAVRHGVPGFAQIGWLANHVTGRLVALGRLQYLVDRFPFDAGVFRHAATGELCVLAPGGVRYRADGQYDGIGGVHDPDAKTTVFEEQYGMVRGNRITRDGRISGETTLSEDWQRAVTKGASAFSVHIPAGVPLGRAACEASLARADRLLPQYFPEHELNAYFSDSWLYDNTFAAILPPMSNIVQFQSLFHLVPLSYASDNQMFERVFGRRYERIEEAPQKTALQKAIVAHAKSGGHFHHAGMLRTAPSVADAA